jgi:hypothetical protein
MSRSGNVSTSRDRAIDRAFASKLATQAAGKNLAAAEFELARHKFGRSADYLHRANYCIALATTLSERAPKRP